MSEPTPVILEEFLKLHPADLADRLQRMELDDAQGVLLSLPRRKAAAGLSEMEFEKAEELLESLTDEQLIGFLPELPHNEIADLLGLLTLGRQRQLLDRLPPEHAQGIRSLLAYSEDSAGGIMTDRFIAIHGDQTVQACMDLLRRRGGTEREDVSYLYVVDRAHKLTGVVPIRELVFAQPDRLIADLMRRDVAFVRVDDDQEEIARRFEHYHYLGLPVLDRHGRLVGIVKATDALEIAREEATEDMQLMVGLSGEERALTPWNKALGRRLPWLYVNLATAFLAAFVVGLFESTIASWTALAIFLPIVAGQGGNAGMQTLTVIIRDMALGELTPGDGRKALIKEAVLGVVNGIAIGIVVGLIGWWWKDSPELGLVAGAAMVLNQIAAALSGVLIPFGLKWFKVDPAMASSIFLTTVTDVAGFFFFLGLGALALKHFVN
ncbi:MAG TPA: magnesium transporter [Verrucomicrobiales bacterium]|nr:magnesium transporter [Verrucomicrobiales bacterium]